MIKGMIGKKVGMTQYFDDAGESIPVTVIEAGPCTVTEVRNPERHGYAAVQLGYGAAREKRMTRPVVGQFKKRNLPTLKFVREFRVDALDGFEVGKHLTVELFEKGHHVDVQGVTKGRGFQGVVKRHGFVAGHASHGPTHGCTTHDQPGSIGASAFPSRVIKGKRLPGRMGGGRVTMKNLQVVAIDAEQSLLVVRGAIPGPVRGYVLVRPAR